MMLTRELLEQLDQRWRHLNAPIAEHLQPGLTDAEMDALTEPLGLRLPTEARIWWGWHDGVDVAGITYEDERAIGFLWKYNTLAEVVAECERCRRLSEEMYELAAGREPVWWDVSWIPISVDMPFADLVCQCDVEPGRPSPIRRITPPEGQPMPDPSAPSFGVLVERWIDAIDRGVWTRRAGRGWWPNYDLMPEGWRLNDIVV